MSVPLKKERSAAVSPLVLSLQVPSQSITLCSFFFFFLILIFFIFIYLFLSFLGVHLDIWKFPAQGLSYTTATATPDPGPVCNLLYHSMAKPDPKPPEQGQGSNLCPHGC